MNDDLNNNSKSNSYKPAPISSNLLYGIVTMIVMVGPLLIPGVTIMHWMMGFFGFTIIFYIIVCLAGIWQNLFGYKHSRKHTVRKP